MRVPISWLRSYCDPGLSTAAVAERLNLSGTEVGRIEPVGVRSPAEFVVGKVVSAERHPNADRLSVCAVDDGSGEPRTIVCGAPNVAGGQTVAVARPGALMPDGSRLEEATLRGVTSSGMILAEDELGLGEDHGGIMVLADELPAGAPLIDHLPIADEVLELEVSPNRPDCLGVYGVARELHAMTGAPLAPHPGADGAESRGGDHARDHASLEIQHPEICQRFTGRVFEGVRVGPSPLWLKARLIAGGQRPISNVVDITNYVMLVTAQPLHAFDLDEVRGERIVVRRARDGERMTTLDGVERTFDSSMALVCDAQGPSGIAGVMGGQVSEVSERTTRVLMEAATWVGTNILQTSTRLGLRSEASARFEKQLHPSGAIAAQRLAAKLMVELCGARLVPGTLDAFPAPHPPRVVPLRPERIAALLGEDVPAPETRAILERLGFGVASGQQRASSTHGAVQRKPTLGGRPEARLKVTVPGFRDADVQREVDLIEEVARGYGLEKLPTTLPRRENAVGRLTPLQRARRRVEDALRDRGMLEIVAYSFTGPRTIERLRLGEEPLLRLRNPLAEDASVMRPLLLPGLLDAAKRSAARGRPGVALFESAHAYLPPESPDAWAPGGTDRHEDPALAVPAAAAQEAPPRGARPAREPHHLAGLMTEGGVAGWRSERAPADFYAAKGDVEAALAALGVEWRSEPGGRPFLHPGRAAAVVAGEAEVGWIGELHPLVAREWDLEGGAAFELDLDAVMDLLPPPPVYRDVAAFPAVFQDIAVIVSEDVTGAEVEAAVRAGGGELLRQAELFDLYRGEQVGAGRKSLALRLEFRADDRTLTDAEVAELRSAIEERLSELGGGLRA